jgi:2,4-dienoyl-CoA reductase-like NADH-dependent reductase (Old Yellow Enzyme family)
LEAAIGKTDDGKTANDSFETTGKTDGGKTANVALETTGKTDGGKTDNVALEAATGKTDDAAKLNEFLAKHGSKTVLQTAPAGARVWSPEPISPDPVRQLPLHHATATAASDEDFSQLKEDAVGTDAAAKMALADAADARLRARREVVLAAIKPGYEDFVVAHPGG